MKIAGTLRQNSCTAGLWFSTNSGKPPKCGNRRVRKSTLCSEKLLESLHSCSGCGAANTASEQPGSDQQSRSNSKSVGQYLASYGFRLLYYAFG
jgi:hypothetical protein